jgi:uncharacterized membrane protein
MSASPNSALSVANRIKGAPSNVQCRPIADVSVSWQRKRMFALWLLPLFVLPALVLWSPVFALTYRRAPQGNVRRYAWVWAWMLPATATIVVLGFTGFIEDVFGSV